LLSTILITFKAVMKPNLRFVIFSLLIIDLVIDWIVGGWVANKMEADLNASSQSVVEDFSPPLPFHEEYFIEERN